MNNNDNTTTLSAEAAKAKQRFSIIGNSPALLQAIERAVKVAPIDLSVLVSGESGTGKEFFPKIIHHFGARKHGKYIAVNCGAIPEGTIDSELFGHEKGAFTGAVSARKGYFEEADGGTIFLDEVAELPLTTQARLLRVLETGEYLKVGSSQVQKTNVRIVAATNVDLLQAVAKGKFREDLYYRLSTVVISVPPLHDRGDDIVLLARKFASDFSERYMTAPITFSPEAQRALMLYRWPGNVRQLKNIVEQLALFEAGQEIDRTTMMEAIPLTRNHSTTPVPRQASPSYDSEREVLWKVVLALQNEVNELKRNLENSTAASAPLSKTTLPNAKSLLAVPADEAEEVEPTEREAIVNALRLSDGNRKKAAEHLDISLRTLYRKLREYEIEE